MSAGMTTVRRGVLRSGIVPVTLIVLAVGLGPVVPAQASARAPVVDSLSPGNSPGAGIAYVANFSSGTVTPITTATSTSRAPIAVGSAPEAIAFTPDGKTAYVANAGSDSVTPISTATNAPGPQIPVDGRPFSSLSPPTARPPTSSPVSTRSPRSQPPPTPPGRRSPLGSSPEASRSPPTARPPTSRTSVSGL